MIQLSILKIVGYGPWTLTLGSDREHELQMLQASLYGRVQKLFSDRGCTVFQNRSDEFFAVSNGLGLDEHVSIQQSLRESFDVRLAVSIGHAESPLQANKAAYEREKAKNVLDEEHSILGSVSAGTGQSVSIMHLDVDSLTAREESYSPYEISCQIFELYAAMSRYFVAKDALTFFMGGDNFMVVAGEEARMSAKEFIKMAKKDLGMALNCGIGTAATSREAVRLATKSLDTIREIRDSGGQKPDVYELSC